MVLFDMQSIIGNQLKGLDACMFLTTLGPSLLQHHIKQNYLYYILGVVPIPGRYMILVIDKYS